MAAAVAATFVALPAAAQMYVGAGLSSAKNDNREDSWKLYAGSSDRTDVLVGLGVGYSLTKNVGMRLEYEDLGRLSDSGGGSSRGQNLRLSLKYGF